MWNLGLNRGLPKQVLSDKEQLALFRENQKGVKLTRVPGDQFLPLPTKPTSATARLAALKETTLGLCQEGDVASES